MEDADRAGGVCFLHDDRLDVFEKETPVAFAVAVALDVEKMVLVAPEGVAGRIEIAEIAAGSLHHELEVGCHCSA